MQKSVNTEQTNSKEFLKKYDDFLNTTLSKLSNVSIYNDFLIEEVLSDIAKITNASRAYVFMFRECMTVMDNIYEYCSKGISEEKYNLQNLKCDYFPWWIDQLKKRQCIIIDDINNMSSDAEIEKEVLEEQGVKSLVVVPVVYEDELLGYVGLDYVFEKKEIDSDIVSILNLFAKFMGKVQHDLYNQFSFYNMKKVINQNLNHIKGLKAQIQNQEQIILKSLQCERADCKIGQNKENLNDILDYILEILSADLNQISKFEVNKDTEIKDVICNKIEIGQVILNILNNSLYELNKKYTIIESNDKNNNSYLSVRTYEDENYVICEVTNNGTPIPEKLWVKVFEPFYTTKEIGEGTGLGLSIAYDIVVNKYKGDIFIKDSNHTSTTFVFKLPKL